ncbi:hypothetical protein PIB30_039668 [Stylosanthes scabra]|uniref:Uncharacterized protein n=1 Tax=Stylosanthes scabra TaxID=79078 RepID=A0ABU6VCA1_9FABA|nr:hypothetical protein [Stylosanthes scabra]
MYRMQCVKVGTLVSGEIDCADLKASLLLAHKDKPAIVNLNIGTTMKGAVDDIDLAPKISFKRPIGSACVSGHKFLGCPIPCGVVITRREYINTIWKDVEYIGSRDATITGSRSGHAPIFLWHAITARGSLGLQKEAEICIMNARYLHNRLREARIGAMLNEYSNTVVFEKPLDDEFSRGWSLACKGNIAHVVVMQHVTIEMLDSFVAEFIQKRSFWWFNDHGYGSSTFQPPCIAEDVGVASCCCSMHGLSS